MKRTILVMSSTALLLSVAFIACKKENSMPAGSIQEPVAHQQRTGDLTLDFGYTLYTLTNNDGSKDFKCLRPKTDCTKVKSPVTSTRNDQEHALDNAIAGDSVDVFFQTSSNWDELLPNLLENDDQKGWLEALTSGTSKLIKRTDLIDGGILYVAYKPSVDPDSLTDDDVRFAIGLTDSE